LHIKYIYIIFASAKENRNITKTAKTMKTTTIYRNSLDELAAVTFVSENEELEHTHYPGAAYRSIFDY
jgi:hypothetical protein